MLLCFFVFLFVSLNSLAPLHAQEALQESASTPEVSTTGDELELLEDLRSMPQEAISKSRPWQPPDYSNQANALGYTADLFSVPPALAARVEFWKQIYSKLSTQQGVLHDSHYINLIYETVDLAAIENRYPEGSRSRQKAVKNYLKERKKYWSGIVLRLGKIKDAATIASLSGDELEVWKKFELISEANKFQQASQKGRIRFQLGQKDRFVQGIFYSGRYLEEMQRIFREEGLPVELTRLPFVESSFNIYARSRVGASGIWQFMRRTARPFMFVNNVVDERNDPIRATRSSARLLRQNYEMLTSWPLAITGYNHGPYGVLRITRKLGTRDLPEIIERYSSKTFGFASENFYACFLAALAVERDAKAIFGNVVWSEELKTVEVPLTRPLQFDTLLAFFGGNFDRAQFYNLHLLKRIQKGRENIPRKTFIRLPPEQAPLAEQLMSAAISEKELLQKLKENLIVGPPTPVLMTKATETQILPLSPEIPQPATFISVAQSVEDQINASEPSSTPKLHKVRRGDNLERIARKYKVTVRAIKESNRLRRDHLAIGQTLTIPALE